MEHDIRISALKFRVMSRVYMEYVKNILVRRLDYILPGLFMAILFASVSIQSVFNNMPKDDVGHTFHFLYVAFVDTEWIIQGALGLIALWACFIASKFTYKVAFKKNDLLKIFGPLKLKY